MKRLAWSQESNLKQKTTLNVARFYLTGDISKLDKNFGNDVRFEIVVNEYKNMHTFCLPAVIYIGRGGSSCTFHAKE